MEWLSTVFKPLSIVWGVLGSGTNNQVLSVFEKAPQIVGNNIYAILIGLMVLKWLAKKTPWAGDDKISTMLSGAVKLIMSGGFTQANIAKYLGDKLNEDERISGSKGPDQAG